MRIYSIWRRLWQDLTICSREITPVFSPCWLLLQKKAALHQLYWRALRELTSSASHSLDSLGQRIGVRSSVDCYTEVVF